MPTPLGHAIIGYTFARELGFTPRQAALAGTFATLPDIDMPLGLAHKGDLFGYHRGLTHTLPFSILSGLVACALHRRLRPGDGRHAAETTGVLIHTGVASHLIADSFQLPTLNRKEDLTHERVFADVKKTIAWETLNVFLEIGFFGIPAWLLARRRRAVIG